MIVLPSAPPQYDVRDQRELRRVLMNKLRELERRIQALENA